MQDMMWDRLRTLLIVAAVTGSLGGCTTTNPATGQQQIDYGATAGVAGAAMGAAALGVALSNNNNDRVVYGGPGWGGGNSVNSVTRVNNVNVNRSVNNRVNRVNRNPNLNRSFSRSVNQENITRGGNRNLNRGGNRGRGNRGVR